ncbi:hypothetical protein [Streptomyces sp. NPDC056144]|uniref:hypothetical protein n=1 Tax=unclassified Streptomyces TaxID=2593676 RepID=UPI0035DBE432
MTTEQAPVPDRSDVEAALGRMVYQAASLETVMRFSGEMLSATEQESKALVNKTAGTLLPAVQAIVDGHPQVTEAERGELARIIADAGPHLTSRNTYIHGAWGEVDGTLMAINRRKNGFRTRPLVVTDLDVLSGVLQELVNRTFEWLYPVLQRTHPDVFGGDASA